jgi:phenylalanyl-tRNA synthetase beta chain
MQISLKWINELVNIETVNLDYLIEKLTLGGFEVEEILEVEINNEKTITLDISATANRSDSLSIQGVSLEIGALLKKISESPKYTRNEFYWQTTIENLTEITTLTNHCSVFISLTVENLSNLTIPKWLQQKLSASGLSITNSLLDFQNYILLETGSPFEFYDLDKIRSKSKSSKFNLSLELSTNNEIFLASDGLEYQLNNSILLVKSNNSAISIGGMIPHNSVACSMQTKSLLIEASIFDSTKIRQQSRLLGLRTNRSARYEKSIKNTNILESCYRLVSLLKISNPNLNCKLITIAQAIPADLSCIALHYQTINRILGPIKSSENDSYKYIQIENITDFLERLKFDYDYDSKNLIWKVTIPYLRSDDITSEIDLIEEIGRLYGFNNFLTQLPPLKKIGKEDFSYQTRKKLTSCLINLGLNELIHYSLVNEKTYIENEVKLVNPLVKDYANLRSSLLPSLIITVEENIKKGNGQIEGFEYGHIFSSSDSEIINEKESIAGIFGGITTKQSWSNSPEMLNWFEAKGKIEQLFTRLNFSTYWKIHKPANQKNILHPYCTAEIFLSNGISLGIFGQVNPILSKKLNISSNLFLFEFDVTEIRNQLQTNKLVTYYDYPIYPKIVKNLSFIISKSISFNELKEILYFNGTQFLKEINLLDKYQGQSISKDCISLCLQFVFQSTEKTLQTKEIENIINNLQLLLIKKFNVTIRN